VTNCSLKGNLAISFRGRGALGGTLYNCMLTGNSAISFGGDGSPPGWGAGAAGCTLYNSIVYYNFGGNYDEGTVLNFSCTTPLPTNGVGNITGPPLFMDWAAGDFRLREESPCIDAGTNLLGFPIMQLDDGYNWVIVGHISEPTDMLGYTRFIDGNFDGRVAWDIGAYEFNSFRPPRFTSASQLTPDGWKMNVTGAANQWVRLQRSSDLRNWEDFWNHGNSVFFMGSEGNGA